MDIVTYALLKKNKLTQVTSYNELPSKGTSGATYITKDNGQMYYWDEQTQTYVKVGESGKTGVYSYSGNLSTTIGADTEINKTDLSVIIAPTVPYSEGSEVTAANSVQGLIVSSTSSKVTVKTISADSNEAFIQVATVSNLPATGQVNVLYAVKDTKEFKVWNSSTNSYETFPIKPTGVNNTQIHTTVSATNAIEATLQNDSINKTHLSQALKDEIDNKQDLIQYTSIPTAAASLNGKIIQYIGTTTLVDPIYENGLFYKCVEDSENPGSYIWINIDVEDNSSVTYWDDTPSSTTITTIPIVPAPGSVTEEMLDSGVKTKLNFVGVETYSGTTNPASSLGKDGDVYFLID